MRDIQIRLNFVAKMRNMKKIAYFLFCGIISLGICVTLSGCLKKDVYKGLPDEEEPQPIPPPSPDENENKIPDLSVPKTFDWSEVYINIPVADNLKIENVKVSFPPLKYGKSFVYSYTFDDCTVMAYGKAFCTINKKWVDDSRFFHLGQKQTSGFTPSKTLGYTDGCGNERRFSFGVAIWPDMSNSQIDNFMNPTNKKVDGFYPHLVWRDLVPLIDFGCDIYFHDINTSEYGTTVEGILRGMKAVQEIANTTLGRKMKILSRPNGNNDYCTAARQYDDIVMMMAENTTDIGPDVNITFDNELDLRKIAQHRRYVEAIPTLAQLWPEINTKAFSGTYAWTHDFSHGPADLQYVLDLLAKINDVYGKDGLDTVWFATLDEVYEYNYLRQNCVIEKSLANNVLTLKVSCPSSDLLNEFMFHRDFSIIVEDAAIAGNGKFSVGNSVYGISYAKQQDSNWLFNLDCNKSLLDKAERYTTAYEKDKSASTKEDALYFANQLKKELRDAYLNRLK